MSSADSLSFRLQASLKNSSLVAESARQETTAGPSDNDLIVLVQEGSEEAFGQLFDRYYVAVRSVARKILRNSEDVADVVQEAFLDVYQGARSFDPAKGTLKTWISYLAYHRSLKRVQLLKRVSWLSADPDEAVLVEDAALRPDHWIRSLDFRRCLDTVFANLNEKQQRTMVLHFFEGQELVEIADRLGESLGNTRHHLYRGLAKLRIELVQNGLLAGYTEFDGSKNKAEVAR